MRVVGGTLGGRRYSAPSKIPARPTTDMAREGLFNILQNGFELAGCSALDLFSGTGSITYELASRAASKIIAVEADAASVAFINATALSFGIGAAVSIVKTDVFKFITQTQESFDIIFADPPYAHPKMLDLPNLIFQNQLLKPNAWLVIEHDRRTNFESHPNFLRAKKYGDSQFSFFTLHQ